MATPSNCPAIQPSGHLIRSTLAVALDVFVIFALTARWDGARARRREE